MRPASAGRTAFGGSLRPLGKPKVRVDVDREILDNRWMPCICPSQYTKEHGAGWRHETLSESVRAGMRVQRVECYICSRRWTRIEAP